MKKYLLNLLIICMTLFTLTGCSKPSLTPDESVKALYDLYILENSEGVLSLGMTKEDVTNVLTSYNQALTDSLTANITSAGLTMDDATIAEIVNARKSALKNMTATCELISSDEESAVVLLKTTYFNEKKLDKKAANKALDASQNTDSTDEAEMLAIATNAYAQNLIDGYLSVTPSSDYKEIIVNCSFKDNVWLPDDMSAFGRDLGIAISGQKTT